MSLECFDIIVQGDDALVKARTGTGKTLAFALPLSQILLQNGVQKGHRSPCIIVLSPTRELANQV